MIRIEKASMAAMRELCIERDWFTCGTNEQYDKLFDMANALHQYIL